MPHSSIALPSPAVSYRTANVEGIDVFYREAGPRDALPVVLLHGFPSSSFMFRDLIPLLADRFRVLAPDYPGFGYSDFPDREGFEYGFASYARLVAGFLDGIGVERCALYVQDYGAPIGLRVALRTPERIAALIVQNGNAYVEGLSEEWQPLEAYWRDPTAERREQLRGWLTPAGIRAQYVAGLPEETAARMNPDAWMHDALLLARPGNIDLQLDLFHDYRTNVELYPAFQSFLRNYRPPTLVAWGRRDPFFTVAGAQSYRRDVPDAEIHLLDTGHFALETHVRDIAALMRGFLGRVEKRANATGAADVEA